LESQGFAARNRAERARHSWCATADQFRRNSVDIIPVELMPPNPAFPAWWNWELSFTPHAELRMDSAA
jgi:hypothetical protein